MESDVVPISAIESEIGTFTDKIGSSIVFKEGLLETVSGEKVDIGFVCKVQPINFYNIVIEDAANTVLEKIHLTLNPDNVEHLIELYFKKIEATNIYIPAKNETGKTDGADAGLSNMIEL